MPLPALLGPLSALMSSLTWALGSTVYAAHAGRVGAVEVNLSRALIVLPLFALSAAAVLGGEALAGFGGERLLWLFLSTLCSYGIGDTLFYLASLHLGTQTALAIASVFPLWATLLGVLTLGEQLSAARLCGTLACVAGVVWLVLLMRARATAGKAHGGRAATGLSLALLTSFLWAGNTYFTRCGAVGLPLLSVNAVRYTLALGILLPLHLLSLRRGRRDPHERLLGDGRRLLGFSGAAVLEAFIGSSLFVYGLSHTPLGIAAPLCALSPLFAVPIGVVLGTERLDLRRAAAIAVTVLGGVLLVS